MKNKHTDESEWIRIKRAHEPLIDKEIFEKAQERIEELRDSYHKSIRDRNPQLKDSPENKFYCKISCGECGKGVHLRRQAINNIFVYRCKNKYRKDGHCLNQHDFLHSDVEDAVFSVIKQHMTVCIEKLALVRKLNARKDNVMQYNLYAKEIARLRREVQRISRNKNGLYEDYRDRLITTEELCQYQKEYEEQIRQIEEQIEEQIDTLLIRQRTYEKDFHINEDWEETVNKYLKRRKSDQVKQSLTLEIVDAFVSKVVCYHDGNIEVRLVYDDFMRELLEISEEREAANGK